MILCGLPRRDFILRMLINLILWIIGQSVCQCKQMPGKIRKRSYFSCVKLHCQTLLVFAKSSKFVTPVPDQVQDDGSGIQNLLKLLDSGYRIESGIGPAGMTL
jgi:hypothetical protein